MAASAPEPADNRQFGRAFPHTSSAMRPEPGRATLHRAFNFLFVLSALLLLTPTNCLQSSSQLYVVCKDADSNICVTWPVESETSIKLERQFYVPDDSVHCGLSDLKWISPHRKFMAVNLFNDKSARFFCNTIKLQPGVPVFPLDNIMPEIIRTRRQANYRPRGRYRGQTQSQYLSVDGGNGKDDGKAEAHSAADSSRAIVSGNSGMGQAQSQTMYDPSCDDCIGRSDTELASLMRGSKISANGQSLNNPNLNKNYNAPGQIPDTSYHGSNIDGSGLPTEGQNMNRQNAPHFSTNQQNPLDTNYMTNQPKATDGQTASPQNSAQPGQRGGVGRSNNGYTPNQNSRFDGSIPPNQPPENIISPGVFGSNLSNRPGSINQQSPIANNARTNQLPNGNVDISRIPGNVNSGIGSGQGVPTNLPNGIQRTPNNAYSSQQIPNGGVLPNQNTLSPNALPTQSLTPNGNTLSSNGGSGDGSGPFNNNQGNPFSWPILSDLLRQRGAGSTYFCCVVGPDNNLQNLFGSNSNNVYRQQPYTGQNNGPNGGTSPIAQYGGSGQTPIKPYGTGQVPTGQYGGPGQGTTSPYGGIGQIPNGQNGGSGQTTAGQYGGPNLTPTGQYGGTGQIPTSQYGGTGQPISGQYGGTGQTPTGVHRGTSQTLPGQYEGTGQKPGGQYGGTGQIPGTNGGTGQSPTGQYGGITQTPTQYGAPGQPPSSQYGGTGQIPNGMQGGFGQSFPGQYGGTGQSGPSQYGGIRNNPLGANGETSQTPSGQYGGPGQGPIGQYGGTGQVPSGQYGGPGQGPIGQYGETGQTPAGQYGGPSRGPSGQYDGTGQTPTDQYGGPSHGTTDTHGTGPSPIGPIGGPGQISAGQYGGTGPTSTVQNGIQGQYGGPTSTTGQYGGIAPIGPFGTTGPGNLQPATGPSGGSGQIPSGSYGATSQIHNGPYGSTVQTPNLPYGGDGQSPNKPFGGTGQISNGPYGGIGQPPHGSYGGTGQTSNGPYGGTGQTFNGQSGSPNQIANGPYGGMTGLTPNGPYGGTGHTPNSPYGGTGQTFNGPYAGTGQTSNGPYGGIGPTFNGPSGGTGQTPNGPYGSKGQTSNEPYDRTGQSFGGAGQLPNRPYGGPSQTTNGPYGGSGQNFIGPSGGTGKTPNGPYTGTGQTANGPYGGTSPTSNGPYGGAGQIPNQGGQQTSVIDSGQEFNNQGIGTQDNGVGGNGEPQNVVDPNSILSSFDDYDSEAQASVAQAVNGTTALATSKGGNEKGRAQTQVEGTYTGTGSFSANAEISDDSKAAQSHVSGSKKGASSSAEGRGRKNKSQASVKLGSETGSILTDSQSSGDMHSSSSQVQGSVKGGMADAQAKGPGSTSSQAQIGFTPYKEEDKEKHDTLKAPFEGGGTASAQSSRRMGTSQSQLRGTFKYGISYNGAAQAGSSLDKDAVFSNLLPFDKINVFDESNKNINIEAITTEKTLDVSLSNTEYYGQNNTTEKTKIKNIQNSENEYIQNTENNYSDHLHLDHHKSDNQVNVTTLTPPVGNRRSFQTNYANIGTDYEYPTDKDDAPEEYEIDDGFGSDGNENAPVEQGEYANYDELSRDTESTHQSLQSTIKKPYEIKQTTGGNTQHIFLGSLSNHDAKIIQKNSEHPDETRVYQPGEKVPGMGGYTIPTGFTGSVKSVASKDNTYVVGSKYSPSQAQTVKLAPGTGKIKYLYPNNFGKNVNPNELRSLYYPKSDDNRYVSVSKSVTRDLDSESNIRKQYSHTYYTKSSSCGYFTFTCTMVSSAEGKKKICKPKIPTNPDGTPMRC